MSAAMQLSTIILIVLKSRRARVHLNELYRLVDAYFSTYGAGPTPSQQKIQHELDLLVEDGFVIKTYNGAWEEFQIANKGYAKLRAWYAPKKLISIMSNDFAKILSIVATILSIFATYLSIRSRY